MAWLPSEQREAARREYRAGVQIEAIASTYGVPISYVGKLVGKYTPKTKTGRWRGGPMTPETIERLWQRACDIGPVLV